MKIEIQSLSITEGKLVVEATPKTKHLVYQVTQEFKNSKKLYIAEIAPEKRKRSLNSNSYFWHLTGEIANLLRTDKEVLYFELLKRYGESQMVSVVEEGVEILKRSCKYTEEAGESVLNGKTFKHFKIYTGSSEMDAKSMCILIEGVVSEAKLLDIETFTPSEIALMNSAWTNE